MLELGAGFAFVGRQVLLNVGGDEFFIDLLFYHLKLRCYVVIELKRRHQETDEEFAERIEAVERIFAATREPGPIVPLAPSATNHPLTDVRPDVLEDEKE